MTRAEPLPPPDLLEVEDIHVRYASAPGRLTSRASVHAVDGVSFSIARGETLGLVGESGCGKSSLGRAVLRLVDTDGIVRLGGTDITQLRPRAMRGMRQRMQLVFQDPYESLNRRMAVGRLVMEPLDNYKVGTKADRRERARELLGLVGLPADIVTRYPHELSGGQRQRVAIARALSLTPEFVVCDEAVSALDVSIQAQVLNLLTGLRNDLDLTYLFISHDLAVVHHVSDRIAVMYDGKIVELGGRDAVCRNSAHPYTRALLSAIPIPNPRSERLREKVVLQQDIASDAPATVGCRVRSRCWLYERLNHPESCQTTEPELLAVGDGHLAACHFASDARESGVGARTELWSSEQPTTHATRPPSGTTGRKRSKS